MANPNTILFDFGGTLDADGVHWSSRFYSHYQRAGVAIGRRVFDAAFIQADGVIAQSEAMEAMTLQDLLRLQVHLQMRSLGITAPDRLDAVVQGCYAEATSIITRNARILAQLGGRYRLGVVANFSGNLRTVCREFGLERFFDVILDSKIVRISKPDVRLFQLALERLQRVAKDCYFVGDSFERDILPAKALGMRTIWLRGATARPCPDQTKVDFVISTLTELAPILANDHV